MERDGPGRRYEPRARASPATPSPTSRSSAPATRDSGPRTSSGAPTRRCGSWCANAKPSVSERPVATAAGAPRCSPGAATRPRAATAGTRSSPCNGRCSRRSTRSSRRSHGRRSRATGHAAARSRSRRSPRTARDLRDELADHRAWGFGDDDYRELTPAETDELIGCRPNLGGLFTPHCAAIHPAKLVHGLARAVERSRRDDLREHARSTRSNRGACARTGGPCAPRSSCVRPRRSARSCPACAARWRPIYSLMIATEPLPEAFWADARMHTRPTFADFRHMIIYGQRTADGRIAFGGRGTPYHFGSRDPRRVRPRPARLRRVAPRRCGRCSPALGDAAITHRWGGAVAVPRDWYPSVGFDRATGIAWAGGYVGDGVSTTNLAGRTIADLVLDRDTDLVRLPWVGHRSPRWEPEPLRCLGVNALTQARGVARPRRSGRARPEVARPGRRTTPGLTAPGATFTANCCQR